jgi:voltage-gated potassium channel Kch
MLLTPALFILYERLILPRLAAGKGQAPDPIDEPGTVIIAGIGRFGQIVNRLLVASGVRTVVLDHEARMIDLLRKFGVKSYFGDASRPDLLQAAGIEGARALVIAIDDRDRAVQMVEYVRRHHPGVRILARAYDVDHLYLLQKAGAHLAVREVFDGSLALGEEVLRVLGVHPFKVARMTQAFRRHDRDGLDQLYELWDQNPDVAKNRALLERARAHGETLKDLLETDRLQLHDRTERGWTPPPKGYSETLGGGSGQAD